MHVKRGAVLTLVAGLLVPTFEIGAQYSYVPSPPPCPAPALQMAARRASGLPTVGVLSLHLQRTNSDQRYLADAFPDVIARRLASIERVALFAPYAVRRLPPSSAADARRVSREMGTRFLVTGALTMQQGKPRLEVVLFDTLASQWLWRQDFAVDGRSVASAAQSASIDIATRVLTTLTTAEQAALSKRATTNDTAFLHYLRGLDAAREHAAGYALRASGFFRDALAKDPSFAQAHAEQAAALATMLDAGAREALANPDSVARLALTHAERAIELNERLARAWTVKGMVLGFTPARWADARAAFTHAMTLDPRNPEIGWQRGRALLRMGMTREADESFRDVLQLSPDFAPAYAALGDLALAEQKTEPACGWLNAAIAADPYAPLPYALRAIARRGEKDVRLAWSDAEIAMRLGARASGEAASAMVDVSGGDSTRARGLALKLFREFDRRARLGILDARLSALALVAVGERTRAITLLERAYPRDGMLGLALAHPAFNTLRSDERFRRILSDVSLVLDDRSRIKRTPP